MPGYWSPRAIVTPDSIRYNRPTDMDMASLLHFEGYISVPVADFPNAISPPGARKEAMKVYMREYRRRQKYALDSLPDMEKERILDIQRRRVRDRVRRHRQRKKLRAMGLEDEEVEKRLLDLVPNFFENQIKAESSSQDSSMPTLRQHLSMALDRISASFDPQELQQSPTSSQELSQTSFACNLPVNNMDFGMALGMPDDSDLQSDLQESDLDPRSWNPSQVGVFLVNLNLARLQPIFHNHNIDGQTLLGLTAGAIKGFVPDDARLPLLSAIDSLKQVIGA